MEIKKAQFRFIKYAITKTEMLFAVDCQQNNLSLSMEPQVSKLSDKNVELELAVAVENSDNSIDLKFNIVGYFEFDGDIDSVKPFLAKNAPAIMFPYIRSYVSTITALSGMAPIILPTINVSKIGDTIIEQLNKIN